MASYPQPKRGNSSPALRKQERLGTETHNHPRQVFTDSAEGLASPHNGVQPEATVVEYEPNTTQGYVASAKGSTQLPHDECDPK
jgi:hypothetical protein